MARVPYLQREDAGDDHQAIFDRLERERRHPTPNIFLALAHAPEQLDGLLTYSAALRSAHELGPRLRELAILSIAYAKGEDYVAAHHVPDALRAGFTETQVAALRDASPSGEVFDDLELAVVRLARAAAGDGPISQDDWDAVAKHLDHRQVVQLTLTIGWYVQSLVTMRLLELDLEKEFQEARSTP